MKRKISNFLFNYWWLLLIFFYVAVLWVYFFWIGTGSLAAAYFRESSVFRLAGTLFVFYLPAAAGHYFVTNWYVLKINKIRKIKDKHERLRQAEALLKAYVMDQNDNDMPSSQIKAKVVVFYFIAIYLMSDFEDYPAALDYFGCAITLSARLKAMPDELTSYNIKNQCHIWEAVTLALTGDASAETKIEPFIQRMSKLNEWDRSGVWLARIVIAIKQDDIAAARKHHKNFDILIRELAVKSKRPDLIYDSILYDGILDKMEGNLDLSRQKLEDVLQNATDEGNRLRAKKEMPCL